MVLAGRNVFIHDCQIFVKIIMQGCKTLVKDLGTCNVTEASVRLKSSTH